MTLGELLITVVVCLAFGYGLKALFTSCCDKKGPPPQDPGE